jgi:hypothetical protein
MDWRSKNRIFNSLAAAGYTAKPAVGVRRIFDRVKNFGYKELINYKETRLL